MAAKKRAFVRYTKSGKIVPGSLIVTTKGGWPRDGLYVEVSANLCCTTTTTTNVPVSDVRLKDNLQPTGRKVAGLTEYTWEWNDLAKDLGVTADPTVGVLAQDALELYPEHVTFDPLIGFYRVDLGAISRL